MPSQRPIATVRSLLVRTVRPYLPSLLVGVLAGLGNLGAQLAIPWILRFLVDDVLVGGSPQGLTPAIGLIVLAAALASAFTTLARYAYARLAAGTTLDLRTTLAQHLRRLSLRHVHERRSGETMSLFTADVPVVAEFYENVLGQAIVNLFRFVVTLVILVSLFPGLALAALLLLPIYSLLPILFSRRLRAAGEVLQKRKAELSGDLQDSIAASREVKAFDRERWDAERLRASFTRLVAPHVRLALFQALSSATFLLFWISAGCIYWLGGRQVLAGQMTLGELMAAISYFTYLDIPISAFVGFNSRWQTSLAAAARLVDFLKVPEQVPDRPDARPLEVSRAEVVFSDVHFAYEANQPVLCGLSLRIPGGQRLALVGASGAGKSTLINLLLRLEEPDNGRILIDGQDVGGVTAVSLRQAVGVVFQDSFLFPGTVEDNLRFGDTAAGAGEVQAALEAAYADEFIRRLPSGLATEVGERGVTLSAGQRQRLALARSLLRRPQLLVLDESTSNLDSTAERAVQEGLAREMKGRTVLVIAHRFSTVLAADSIAVLEGGRIEACGTHEELMQTSMSYRRLYTAQRPDPDAL